ncbi:MAG TPA: hypothetical protein VHT73_13605 [Thermodesulfobacteriota bacterium]|nr:hypothetical protein [Thermodesulfobacteriota bacterium]
MSRLTVGMGVESFELVESYSLDERDFLAFDFDTYSGPDPPWHQKAYGFRKQFQEWFNYTLGHEIPAEIYEEMRTRGIREWKIFKKEVRDYFKEINDYKKWHKERGKKVSIHGTE